MKRRVFIVLSIVTILLANFSHAAITKGPYLINPQQTSMTIMWESDTSEKAVISYGLNTDLSLSMSLRPFAERDSLFLYQVHLKQLRPALKYFYQIHMTDDQSEILYFKTAPHEDSAIDFVAIGDSRTGHDIHRSISEAIITIDPDLIISMGDLVGTGGNFEEWKSDFFEPAAHVIDHIPLISTLGDHDTQKDNGGNFHYYLRPTSSADRLWFSYDYGPAHFISLDYRAENDPEMIDWFEKDIAASKKKWKFVYLHRPSYNLGGHRTNWGPDHWPALYRKHKIDIVFAGHSHMYERFYPMRPADDPDAWPVTYITTGGAGASLYESVKHPYLAVTQSVNHLMHFKIRSDTLIAVTILPDMSQIDSFKIIIENGHYNSDYLKLVKTQELMDVHMAFASQLLIRFNDIPSKSKPAIQELRFASNVITEHVKFEVCLAPESYNYYRLLPFKGILKPGQTFSDSIRVYAKYPVGNNRRYFDPPLFFNAYYKTSTLDGVAIGRESRYYPLP